MCWFLQFPTRSDRCLSHMLLAKTFTRACLTSDGVGKCDPTMHPEREKLDHTNDLYTHESEDGER